MTDLRALSNEDLMKLYQQPATPPASPVVGMSDADLMAAHKAAQGPSVGDYATDMTKSAGVGLAEGAIGLAGMPGDMQQLAKKVGDWTASKLPSMPSIPVPQGVKDWWAEMGKRGAIPEHRKEHYMSRGDIGGAPLPSSRDIKGAVEGVTGEFYKSKTLPGEYSRTAASFVPGTVLAPGNAAVNALRYGVVPGLASEAAGQATKDTKWEPFARAGAGIATGVGAGLLSRPAYNERLVGNAARGAEAPQYGAAEQLVRDAQARGITLTPAEAIQQATGGSTRLGDVQRLTESTAGGAERMAPMFAQRPAQMQQATNATLDQIAPRSAAPSFIGREAQEAATGAIDHTRQNINHLAEPFYRNAERVPVPPVENLRLQTTVPGYPEALQTVRDTPQLNRYVQHLPDNSVGVLNEVKKQLNQSSQNVASAVNPNRNVQMSAGYARDAGEVTNTGRGLSRDFGQALDIEAAGRQRVLGPLQSGPAGVISQTDDIVKQGGAVINTVNSPREVTRALQNISQQNPQAARGVVREELGRISDKTVGGLDNAARPDQYGGAKFARAVQGDARTGENVHAAVGATGGPAVADDMRRLVEVLQATGQRQRPGSLTAFNQEALADMKRGGLQGVVQALVKPLAGVKETVQRGRLGSQAGNLADLMLSGPDGVRRIQELAARGNDANAIIARALLNAQAANQANH